MHEQVGSDVSSGPSLIRVYDEADNVIEPHEHKGDFKTWWSEAKRKAATRLT